MINNVGKETAGADEVPEGAEGFRKGAVDKSSVMMKET